MHLESKLNLDFDLVAQARQHASRVADDTQRFIDGYTTVAVERTICRLLGIDGVDESDVPLPNVVVEHLMDKGALAQGAAFWLGNAMLETGKDPQAIAEDIAGGKLDLTALSAHDEAAIHDVIAPIVTDALARIKARRQRREDFIAAHGGEKQGPWIYLIVATGNIYEGQIATVASTENTNFKRFMGWADANRQMKVMTNADNPKDAQNAVDMGAEGIGLCRTEHMFFAEDRIKAVREMICARTVEERKAALAKVEPFQEADFTAMYRIMGERPMTIRYLDPPLHEFLPTKAEDIEALAKDMGMTTEELNNVVVSLHEFNPMMGHRGCRLAVTYPEIAEMQTNAVIKAALKVSAETGKMITPHIMIPLVGEVKELKFVKDVVVKTADALIAAAGVDMKYEVGTMIEIPRAALTAGEIAKEADFFSFGTNDLTQMTFGFSRDDAAKFLTAYYDNKIYESDPFQHLDQIGVGKLVKMAAHDGRATNPNLGLGICGEHGGDPSSVEFCHNVGLDYVSCSPYRVPIARLAAAQAAIKNPRS